jgi:hypothetical protein
MRNLTTGLARVVLRLLGRDRQQGGIGVLVAVVLGGGVLLGMAALAIDVGQIYQNRAELQNGADAGALGVAKSCALGACNSGAAGGYATANSSVLTGNNAAVDLVCGTSTLAPCPAPVTGDMTDCPPIPAVGNFVDVHTSTKIASGSTVLPPVFAETLVGSSSFSGTHVKACAQAEWGPAQQSNSLALTLSLCVWNSLTTGSPFGTPVPIFIKGKAKPCGGPAGQNLPGGFDWLALINPNQCIAAIDLTVTNQYTSNNKPGNSVPPACKIALQNDVAAYMAGNPVTVFLPIFSATSGTGVGGTYTIIGLAGFVIMGYDHLPGMGQGGVHTACTGNGSDPCIEGYFLPGIDPVTSVGGGTNFGALAVRLTG